MNIREILEKVGGDSLKGIPPTTGKCSIFHTGELPEYHRGGEFEFYENVPEGLDQSGSASFVTYATADTPIEVLEAHLESCRMHKYSVKDDNSHIQQGQYVLLLENGQIVNAVANRVYEGNFKEAFFNGWLVNRKVAKSKVIAYAKRLEQISKINFEDYIIIRD
jgi:hypothetical protein